MITRLYFNNKDYEAVRSCVEALGGSKEDFITDDVVELGDSFEYVGEVVSWLNENGISHKISSEKLRRNKV